MLDINDPDNSENLDQTSKLITVQAFDWTNDSLVTCNSYVRSWAHCIIHHNMIPIKNAHDENPLFEIFFYFEYFEYSRHMECSLINKG